MGNGRSRPIMITDDHKTVNANRMGVGAGVGGVNCVQESDVDLVQQQQQLGQRMAAADGKAPSKRKQPKGQQATKKRSKPYDAVGRSTNNSARASREASVVSLGSLLNGNGGTSPSTRESTPSLYFGGMTQTSSGTSISGVGLHTDVSGIAPSDTLQQEQQFPTFGAADMHIEQQTEGSDGASLTVEQLAEVASNNRYLTSSPAQFIAPGVLPPQPLMFFNPDSPPPVSSLPLPKIHRLIPSAGPTYGGIEVTVLGANFHPAMTTLNCVFGGTVASYTQRWSDNTLVCILPPRAAAGAVAVWFDGVAKGDGDEVRPCMFTYTDDSDRALYVFLSPFVLSSD